MGPERSNSVGSRALINDCVLWGEPDDEYLEQLLQLGDNGGLVLWVSLIVIKVFCYDITYYRQTQLSF
jgi:hypothetical protein